jgi:hypothetical protein
MKASRRVLALAGSTLMVAGVVGAAGPAMATDNPRRGGDCSVELDQRGNSRILDVEVDGPRLSGDVARVRLDFDRDRRRDRTEWLNVELDRRGDGSEAVRAPRLTDEVTATAYIRTGGGRGFVTCTGTLDLDRRGPRG